MRTFYSYLWLREDGTPYYVGKGTKRRAYDSRLYHRPPKDRTRIIVQEFASEEDALFAECFLIALFGRKDLSEGCLINLTDGGESGNRSASWENGGQLAKLQASRTPEQRSEAARKAALTGTPEERSQRARRAAACMKPTPHCRNGHLRTSENTMRDDRGILICKTCRVAAYARRNEKKRQATPIKPRTHFALKAWETRRRNQKSNIVCPT
jgi:hypothetical protein